MPRQGYPRASERTPSSRTLPTWPRSAATGLPLLRDHAAGVAFRNSVALVLKWNATAVGAFFVLGVLNIAFAQLLVIPNLAKNRVIWFIAWLGYTLAPVPFPII